MNKKKKVLLIVVIVLLISLCTLGFLYYKSVKTNKNKATIKTVDSIKDFGYSLKETDSKLKREKFKELKDILKAEDVDYEAYANKLAEIFVVDVYDLDSKINKYDVGGLEYVLEDNKDTLKLKLQDTLYSNLQDNSDQKRTQKLPIVTAADAKELEEKSYKLKETNYDGYLVKVTIDYKEDLGYDKSVSVQMIKNDNKLYVVVVKPD